MTSTKLAEAFMRGRKKSISSSTAPTGLILQYGWDYITGNGSTTISKSIVFPKPFSGPPLVICDQLAARSVSSGTPSDTDAFVTGFSNASAAYPNNISTSGFDFAMTASSTFSNTFNFGMQWLAIGPA